MASSQTAERVSDTQVSDNFVFRRSLLAYEFALPKIGGHTLEVGSGEGYGLRLLSNACTKYSMIDKYAFEPSKMEGFANAVFIQTEVPPFKNIPDNTFDFVVSFQVIEHIKNDKLFVSEIHRVLKPGGKFLCTTPNKKMSLSRNPWHIREYYPQELKDLLLVNFSDVETLGVFGGPKAMEYYEKNKKSVNRIMRFDIFKMQYWLPRWILRVPYDLMNRRNRNKLLEKNQDLTSDLTTSDFYIQEVNEQSLDLYYISTK
jgi:ubiquinone/menaquinone biosynthesis C-methylase UbiE